jgi:hypothetical protein
MLKGLARRALRTIKSWLEEETNGNGKGPHSESSLNLVDGLCARILQDEPERPNYVWGVVNAAALARNLNISRISVLELGVAGGNGLVALEKIAERVGKAWGLQIDVYGFDSGIGLPKPVDYRDLPQLFSEGFFSMDVEKLRARLKTAKISLGFVEKTIPEFLESNPAPVGFAAFDLDLYTSTLHALQLFEAVDECLLPRIFCYFDDILGFSYSDFTGELLAISEFNGAHKMRKISKINGMRYVVPAVARPGAWVEQFYMAHLFDHKLYNHYDGSNPKTQLTLYSLLGLLIPVLDTFTDWS